ncbi:helix-turn-helix domain-containing protein [Amycolatopsis sp. NPDC059021]|uniref:helix-turn-helix domain-containing protein n=1 Tax=Amycolatopsis sp. NPDC059021 TaxID=3346704 RepID=UPI00366DDFA1
MTVTVGLVLHAKSVPVFEEAARTLTGVTCKWAVYPHDDDIPEAAAKILGGDRLDGLLMGLLPHDACRHLLPGDLAVAVVRPPALSLSLAFARAMTRNLRPGTVSIDTFAEDAVDEVSTALGLRARQVVSLPYRAGQPAAEIVEHHLRAVRRGGFVISARTEVTHRLRGKVPVVQSLTVPSTVRAELHDLVLRLQSRQAAEFRFAAGVFLVAAPERDVDRARVGLMNLLLNTPEFADAWIENRGRRGVIVLAHQALFDRMTHQWLTVPVLGAATEKLGVRVAAGFGIGGSARTCVTLAERAAARAEAEGRPSGYLVQDTGVIIGPMGPDGVPAEFTYRDHGARLEQLARRVGLSAATLSRLVSVERGRRGRTLSSAELANALGITDPSGRRLLRTLLAGGLVTPEGSEQTHRKGRPATLFRLGIERALQQESPALSTNLDT